MNNTSSPSRCRTVSGEEIGRLYSESRLSWHFDPLLTKAMVASFAIGKLGALRLAWVQLGRWAGERDRTNLTANPEPYLTVLMPVEGEIILRSGSKSNVLPSNNFQSTCRGGVSVLLRVHVPQSTAN